MSDDELDNLLQVTIDTQRRERGSKLALTASLALARRLSEFADRTQPTLEELEYFARPLCGFGHPDAERLYQLDAVAQQVLDRCEAERKAAIAAGDPYEYPEWRTALSWFCPEHDEVAALHRRVAELEAEVAALEDRLTNPEPQRDSKRWFEQELLAVTWG